jgi:hypothetical protein
MAVRHAVSRHAPMKLVEGARIEIAEIRNAGLSETLVLANRGHADQPLTGWCLVSFGGTKVFRFPDGYVLGPGEAVKITSGEDVAHHPPKILAWTDEAVWNNRGDVALLFDWEGEEVARHGYPASRAVEFDRIPPQRLVVRDDGRYALEALSRRPDKGRRSVRSLPARA